MNEEPLDTRILVVVTSHDAVDEENPTGVWLEEFARPYDAFVAQGYTVEVASPRGGVVPIDPSSEPEDAGEWEAARARLGDTLRLSDVVPEEFDALYLPGGHGTMFDFPDDPELQRIVRDLAGRDRVIAAVCHGPAAFANIEDEDGRPLVEGVRLTAFTDAEERETGLQDAMPFLLESRLRERGAEFVAEEPWSDHVEVDGAWITGQNPQSSGTVGVEIVHAIQERKAVETGTTGP
ncbi:MAG: type 1 glutamine amidotransferase domain-containing protein [Gemmatimonadetes bacterium]|nr:type 1 glutamine amidotransferase domain-containing protein [Gemmatimonadota bacterium]